MKVTTGAALSALALAALAQPTMAADLGGNCCADLEERVAELEATTARKGNRKVSLELYGQVNQAVLFWDDGSESNAYVVTNDNSRTRIGFRGKAKIDADWEAGYRIEIGIRSANSKRANQDNPTGNDLATDIGFDIRDSQWFVKSKTYGALSIGLQASATDQITEINQTQTADFSKYSDVEDTGLGLLLRSSRNGRLTNAGVGGNGQTGLTWRRLIGDGGDQPGEGERRYNAVKYATPEFAGFAASASWGQDDFWDVALRYTGSFSGFKVASGIGYFEQTDQTTNTNTVGSFANGTKQSFTQFGGSLSVLHEATGLFLNLGAGEKEDRIAAQTALGQAGADDGQTFWSIQAGIEKKFFPVGKSTIYGEYYNYEGGGNNRRTIAATDALNTVGGAANIWSSEVEVFGLGVAQGFDAAALTLYISYRHVEGDVTLRNIANGTRADSPIEDLDLVLTGAVIKF